MTEFFGTSYAHTPVAMHRQQRHNAVSRAVAFVKTWAERRRLARDLYALNDHLLADAGIPREDIPAVVNGFGASDLAANRES